MAWLGHCRGRLLGSRGLRRIGLRAKMGVSMLGFLGRRETDLVEAGLELGEDVGHGAEVG